MYTRSTINLIISLSLNARSDMSPRYMRLWMWSCERIVAVININTPFSFNPYLAYLDISFGPVL